MKKAQVKQPKSWWRDGAIVVAIIASLTNISTVMLSAHYTEKSQKHLDRINEAAEINRGQLEKQAQQNVIIAQNMEMMKLDLQRSGDKLRQSNDEARLKMESQASILREAEAKREIAQLVNTVRPRIAQKCDLERLSEGQGRLNCRLENQGQFLVHISTKSLQLLGKDGETVIPSGIRPVGPLPGNNLPPGTGGGNVYLFTYDTARDMRGLTLLLTWEAASDSKDADVVLRQSAGLVRDGDVKDRLSQGYTYRYRLND